jgi:hypothetical protein
MAAIWQQKEAYWQHRRHPKVDQRQFPNIYGQNPSASVDQDLLLKKVLEGVKQLQESMKLTVENTLQLGCNLDNILMIVQELEEEEAKKEQIMLEEMDAGIVVVSIKEEIQVKEQIFIEVEKVIYTSNGNTENDTHQPFDEIPQPSQMELSISESNGVDIVCVPKEAQEALQKKWQAMEESEIVPKKVKSKEIVCNPEKEREPILGILSDRERNYCDEEKVFDKNLKRKLDDGVFFQWCFDPGKNPFTLEENLSNLVSKTIKYMKVEKLQLASENAENKAQEVIVMLPVLICLPLGQVQTDAVLVEVMCMLGSNNVLGEIYEGLENMFDEMPKRKFKLVNIFVLASKHMKLHLQNYFVVLKH